MIPLAPGRTLREARPGVQSALPGEFDSSRYDRHAAMYDRLIGAEAYNRVVWGARRAEYRAFAQEAIGSRTRPFLDAACGTAVFTAPVYRTAERPLVLVDLSVEMLERARARLTGAPVTFIQADMHDLPFQPRSFRTVACFAALHVLDDPWSALAALWEQVAPAGMMYVSMLVSDRAVGRGYMRLLRRAGEFGPPRTAAEFETAASEITGARAFASRSGSMAYLRLVRSPKWNCVHVDTERRFSLDIEEESGGTFVAIAVENSRHVGYDEWYEVDAETFARYRADPSLAFDFVERCKRRELDHLLLLPPGTDRGWA